jgi:type II secretory pathway component PulK
MKPALSISTRKKSGGIALIIVMIAIIVLSALAALLAYSMKVEGRLAVNSDSERQLVWLGRSGVELARYVLAQEAAIPGEPYDSLNQVWAGGPGGIAESNSPLLGVHLDNYQIGNGSVSVKIVDLERYANINTANDQILHQALTLMGVDASQISIVSDSILDWISPGDMPRVAGAKSDYYQGLNPPYKCKDAPIDDMTELLLVRGIWDHPEIYWGGAAVNHPGPTFQHHLGFGNAGETPNYPFGLVDLFTPFSNGRININTAGRNVLQMLMMTSGMDQDTAGAAADSIIKLRAGPDGVDGTEDDIPFQNPNQIAAAAIPPPAVAQIGRFCTTRSSTFRVTVTARLGEISRNYTAILFRNGRDVEVVSFYLDK